MHPELTRSGWAALAVSLVLSASAHAEFDSTTQLSAAQEVPAVDSPGARGFARLRFREDFSEVTVRVRLRDLQGDVTRIHLHCNRAGANGPLAVILADTAEPAIGAPTISLLGNNGAAGTLSNADILPGGACEGVLGQPVNNLVSLAAAIDAGLIYWNIHSTAFPGGELRGQARPTHPSSDE